MSANPSILMVPVRRVELPTFALRMRLKLCLLPFGGVDRLVVYSMQINNLSSIR